VTFLLHHRVIEAASGAAGGRLAFVLHGVLGSGQNFSRFISKLCDERPDFRYVLVDLRHHGQSSGAPPPDTIAACARDLAALAVHLGGAPEVLIGHSFGGKVAIEYARQRQAESDPLRQVWVLDSVPGTQSGGQSEISEVIRAVRSVPVPAQSRRDVVARLVAEGLSSGLAEWMATNLKRQGESYVWTFDLDAIEELLRDYYRVDLWDYLAQPRERPEFELVVAERSDRWDPALRERAQALPPSARAHYHPLRNSGHWVHVDNPTDLQALMVRLLVARG
jgi:pimeloyl-ACP methyl ester carboxylesterase